MRSFHSTLVALVIAGASAGCNTASTTGPEPVGESHARLILSMNGHGSASLRVTAKADTSMAMAIDKSVDIMAGSAVVVAADVPAASYAFHVDVFSDSSQTELLGSAEAHADLALDATTEIKLAAMLDGDGSTDVTVGVNEAPEIDDVDIDVSGGTDGSLSVHVDVSDAEDTDLTFFWSGAGIDGTVKGTATMDISKAALLASGESTLHLVVQDEGGATAAADIAIDVTAETASASAHVSAEECLDASAQCVAACDASLAINPLDVALHASCLADCGLALASCDD